MKSRFAGFFLTFGFVLHASFATIAIAAEDNREADHVALRALRDKVSAAIDKQDTKTLSSCFAKEFAFTAVNQTTVTNETQVQEFFDRMFHASDAPIASLKTAPQADIPTRFLDANTGVCYGSSKDTYTLKSGRIVDLNIRWSATVVKENGEWKVAIAHVGTDFLENPVLTGINSLWKKVAAGGLAGGLIIGIIVGRLSSRRKKTQAANT